MNVNSHESEQSCQVAQTQTQTQMVNHHMLPWMQQHKHAFFAQLAIKHERLPTDPELDALPCLAEEPLPQE